MEKKYVVTVNSIDVTVIATDNPTSAVLAASNEDVLIWIEHCDGYNRIADNEHRNDTDSKLPSSVHADLILQMYPEDDPDDCIDSSLLNNLAHRRLNLPITIAETGRLIIRELSLDDLPHIPECIRPEQERAESYIECMYKLWGFGIWLIILKDTGEIIGKAGLGTRNDCPFYDLGYEIVLQHRNKGYAKEASLAIIEYAKKMLGIDRLSLVCSKENAASLSLAASLGFKFADRGNDESTSSSPELLYLELSL